MTHYRAGCGGDSCLDRSATSLVSVYRSSQHTGGVTVFDENGGARSNQALLVVFLAYPCSPSVPRCLRQIPLWGLAVRLVLHCGACIDCWRISGPSNSRISYPRACLLAWMDELLTPCFLATSVNRSGVWSPCSRSMAKCAKWSS